MKWAGTPVAGVGFTGTLVSATPKRGDHRFVSFTILTDTNECYLFILWNSVTLFFIIVADVISVLEQNILSGATSSHSLKLVVFICCALSSSSLLYLSAKVT